VFLTPKGIRIMPTCRYIYLRSSKKCKDSLLDLAARAILGMDKVGSFPKYFSDRHIRETILISEHALGTIQQIERLNL
jgi:hypothetical protein